MPLNANAFMTVPPVVNNTDAICYPPGNTFMMVTEILFWSFQPPLSKV